MHPRLAIEHPLNGFLDIRIEVNRIDDLYIMTESHFLGRLAKTKKRRSKVLSTMASNKQDRQIWIEEFKVAFGLCLEPGVTLQSSDSLVQGVDHRVARDVDHLGR